LLRRKERRLGEIAELGAKLARLGDLLRRALEEFRGRRRYPAHDRRRSRCEGVCPVALGEEALNRLHPFEAKVDRVDDVAVLKAKLALTIGRRDREGPGTLLGGEHAQELGERASCERTREHA